MKRLIVLLILAAALGGLYWKRQEAATLASSHVPALRPYLGGTATASATKAAPVRPQAGIPVILAKVEQKAMPLTVEAVGTVQPVASIQIKPRLDSQIEKVHVQEGALVKEGDILITLDGRALRAQLAQADALIQKDKAQIEQARRDFTRADDLLQKRIGTEVQRDTAATNLRMQEAQLAADTAQRDNVATLLSYTEIRAPVSGRIGSIALKAGTSIRSADAQAIMTVNQIDPIYVQFAVPQTLFADVRAALAKGDVGIEALVGGDTVPGKFAFMENNVDLATGTVLARAVMSNVGEKLWPGAFVNVRAQLGIQKNALAIPAAAVQLGQQGAYVFVVRDGKRAALTPVKLSRTVQGESVVSDGLREGDQVVVDGQLRLVDGAPVQIMPSKSSEGVVTGQGVGSRPGERRVNEAAADRS